MKKNTIIILIIMMALATSFTGCGRGRKVAGKSVATVISNVKKHKPIRKKNLTLKDLIRFTDTGKLDKMTYQDFMKYGNASDLGMEDDNSTYGKGRISFSYPIMEDCYFLDIKYNKTKKIHIR